MADDSIDIGLGPDAPDEKKSNWGPAAQGKDCLLLFRFISPKKHCKFLVGVCKETSGMVFRQEQLWPDRKGEHEDLVQGGTAFVYRFHDAAELTLGFQGAHRKESFEIDGLRNLNVWRAGSAAF